MKNERIMKLSDNEVENVTGGSTVEILRIPGDRGITVTEICASSTRENIVHPPIKGR